MRKRMFSALVLSVLAVFIGTSTRYAVAWRDSASVDAAAQPYKRRFNVAPLGLAQQSSHATSGLELPVAVDGAKTPERIPDWMAYRHFISVNSLHSSAAADVRARRDARLDRLGLSARDRAALIRALSGRRERLDDIAQRREQWKDNSPAAEAGRHVLRLEEKQVFDTAQQDVLGALSFDGATRLSRHIEDVKTGIVIHGSMPQF